MRSRFASLLKALKWSGTSTERTVHLESPAGPVNMKLAQQRDGTLWVDGVGKPGHEDADEVDHDYIGTLGTKRLRSIKREVEKLSWPTPVKGWQGYRATGVNPGRIVAIDAEK